MIRDGLAEGLLNLLAQLRLGLEEFVIVTLSEDQCRPIRLLNNADTVLCRERRNELDCLIDVRGFASQAAVASEEACGIDAFRAHRLHFFDIGLLLKRSDTLQAV